MSDDPIHRPPRFTSPDENELKVLARELLCTESTMVVATCGAESAWAAPVYFVYRSGALYFFSDPTSRHIRDAQGAKSCAASVHGSRAESWREIRGIQMSGRVIRAPLGLEAVQAVRSYLDKFPFTREWLVSELREDVEAFRKRFGVQLFKFDPTLVYYLDNRFRFGFRAAVRLDPTAGSGGRAS